MASTLFREDEAAFLQELQEGISKGTSWERITDIIELANSRKCKAALTTPFAGICWTSLMSLTRRRIQNDPSVRTWRIGSAANEGIVALFEKRGREGTRRWRLLSDVEMDGTDERDATPDGRLRMRGADE